MGIYGGFPCFSAFLLQTQAGIELEKKIISRRIKELLLTMRWLSQESIPPESLLACFFTVPWKLGSLMHGIKRYKNT